MNTIHFETCNMFKQRSVLLVINSRKIDFLFYSHAMSKSSSANTCMPLIDDVYIDN